LSTYVAGATARWRSLRRKSSQEEGGVEEGRRRRVVDDGDGEEDAFPEAGARAGWGRGSAGAGATRRGGAAGKSARRGASHVAHVREEASLRAVHRAHPHASSSAMVVVFR
jgi:hypothetical protein